MATASDIALVKALLPTDHGMTDEQITALLDSGMSPYEVVLTFWEGQSAKLYALVDVSENSSSRNLSDMYNHAVEMTNYWQQKVQSVKDTDRMGNPNIAFHSLKRI